MATSPSGERPRGRPAELQDALNRYVYHPLSARLAHLLRPTGITPNMVSVSGMFLVWGAAWAYTQLPWPQNWLLGLSLHLLWHVVDGADGDLARLTGKQSPTGEMVDGICDYAGHVLLYVALTLMLAESIGSFWAWTLAVLAGASHIAQTNHAETQKRSYLWWVYGVPWLKNARAQDEQLFRNAGLIGRIFGGFVLLYLKLPNAMTPWSARVDAAVAAAAGDPVRTRRIRRLARAASQRSLIFQKLVGPNPRTILLGVAMAIGSPAWFYLGEIVLLNALLIASVLHHNQVARKLAAKIA